MIMNAPAYDYCMQRTKLVSAGLHTPLNILSHYPRTYLDCQTAIDPEKGAQDVMVTGQIL